MVLYKVYSSDGEENREVGTWTDRIEFEKFCKAHITEFEEGDEIGEIWFAQIEKISQLVVEESPLVSDSAHVYYAFTVCEIEQGLYMVHEYDGRPRIRVCREEKRHEVKSYTYSNGTINRWAIIYLEEPDVDEALRVGKTLLTLEKNKEE